MADVDKVDLRALSAHISRPVRIGLYESVVQIILTDEKATLKTECYEVRETRRELRIVAKGVRLYGWSRSSSGPWDCQGFVTIWDESFVPVIEVKQGKILTFPEWREQVNFERDCYRPGASRFPLDSYDRVFEGSDFGQEDNYCYNTRKMEKHWPNGVPA